MKKKEGLLYFLLFLLLASVYFFRIFTEGAVYVFGDGYNQLYPMRVYAAQALRPTLWTPHAFAGMPFIGLMQTAALYPPNIILYTLLPAPHALNAGLLLHYAMAGFFAFICLREMGLGKLPAFFGATVFALSGFMISTKQHIAILNSAAWLPLIVFFAERVKKTLSVRYALWASLAIAAQVLAGNFQICLYTYIVLLVYFMFSLFEVERGRRLRFAGIGALGVALGLLIAMPQILWTMQLSGLSLRPVVHDTLGYAFAKEFHVYLRTLPSLVFPHLYSRGDFGTLLPVPNDRMIAFIGILPLALAVVAIVKGVRTSNTVRLWAAVGLLGLVLAVADDTPLGKALFHLPVYGMFHANGRNLFEFSLAVSVLFAFGMQHVISDVRNIRTSLKTLAAVAVCAAGALGVTYLAGGEKVAEALVPGNPAVFVPVIFMVFYALGLFLYGLKQKRLLLYALFIVVLAEAYTFGAYHEAGWTEAGKLTDKCEQKGYALLKSTAGAEPFRVASLDERVHGQYNVPCGVGVFNSYDQLIPADYAVLFDLEPFGMSRYWDNLIRNNTLLSMMNVKYLLVPKGSKIRYKDVTTVTGRARAEAPSIRRGPSYLPDPQYPGSVGFFFVEQFLRGTYIATVRAASRGSGGASFRMEVFNQAQAPLRDFYLPFNVYPGIIDDEPQDYYRLYHSDGPQFVKISLKVPKFDPIEIKDVTIRKLVGYGPPPIAASGRVYEKIHETEEYDVILNRNALPRAYSVTGLVGAEDIHEIKRMFDLNLLNPSNRAVLFAEDLKALGQTAFARADVAIVEYGNERVVAETDSPGESFIVLADQYYPGWRALIDGKEARIFKVNGILRGVIVPAGKHELVFEYFPVGLLASLAAGIFIAAGVVVLLITKFRGKRRGQ